ncbi:MAG: hypothetical protein FWB93_00950 [Oscillospiraceae bacterium]|nr:hypothetical protein [Oscillospiraceae bacterium]
MQKPRMMTIREVAREGILTEHALRLMLKSGRLPAIYIGTKALINYDNLIAQLSELKGKAESGVQSETV